MLHPTKASFIWWIFGMWSLNIVVTLLLWFVIHLELVRTTSIIKCKDIPNFSVIITRGSITCRSWSSISIYCSPDLYSLNAYKLLKESGPNEKMYYCCRAKQDHLSLTLTAIMSHIGHQAVLLHFGTQSRELQHILLYCLHIQHMVRTVFFGYIVKVKEHLCIWSNPNKGYMGMENWIWLEHSAKCLDVSVFRGN